MGKPSKREIIYMKKEDEKPFDWMHRQSDRMSTQLNVEYAKSRGNDCTYIKTLLTDNTQMKKYRSRRMCRHLTFIDASISQLYKFYLQCPVLKSIEKSVC